MQRAPEKSNAMHWIMASRPKTLTAAFVPVLVASTLSYKLRGAFSFEIAIYALLAAVFIQIGTNLVNDALDFKKGADTKERLGPIRVTQSGLLTVQQVLAGGMMCFAAALLCGIPMMLVGGWPIAVVLVLSLLCGYLYTGGPKPLAYSGLGDFFVLIFFGFVATAAVFYLHSGGLELPVFVAGAQVGLLSTVMIAVNNLRDKEGDAKANKKTMPVRFGEVFAKWEISFLLCVPFALNAYWLALGYWWAAVLPLALLPLGLKIIRGVWQEPPGPIYNQFLGSSALVHFGFGLLIAVGLIMQ